MRDVAGRRLSHQALKHACRHVGSARPRSGEPRSQQGALDKTRPSTRFSSTALVENSVVVGLLFSARRRTLDLPLCETLSCSESGLIVRLRQWESMGLQDMALVHGCVAGTKGNENRKVGLQEM